MCTQGRVVIKGKANLTENHQLNMIDILSYLGRIFIILYPFIAIIFLLYKALY